MSPRYAAKIGLLVLACAMSAVVPSCATRQVNTVWPDVLDCGPDVPDLVQLVSTILLGAERAGDESTQLVIGDRAIAELERLKVEHGSEIVACLVDLLRREWRRPGLSQSPERSAAAARADSFLRLVGTKVQSNAAFEP